jgi:hypothetical protein
MALSCERYYVIQSKASVKQSAREPWPVKVAINVISLNKHKNYSGDFSSIMASYSIKSSHHHIKCKAMHIYLQFNQCNLFNNNANYLDPIIKCNHILTQPMQTYLMQLA